MDLRGARVLLTGATGGIGEAIARAVAARGADLVLTGRRTEILEPLATETRGTARACDLSDRDALERLLADAGTVDVLIANAALPASGPLDEYTPEQVDRALEVNLRAPIVLAHRLSPGMVSRGRGHIVLVSSLVGKAAQGGASLYSATKFGLRGFGLALRDELRDHGVGVSIVFPGFIAGAGMFHEAGVELPRLVGTRRPQDVAAGVVTAIERNRAEVDVAPVSVRLGAALSGLAPELSSRVQRRLGGAEVQAALGEGQRSKR
jgi:uncharacterized protein